MSRFTDEELPDVNEEEASFYFSLNDFEQLLDRYGADFVLKRMRNESFDKLNVWFSEAQNPTKKSTCFLTSTPVPLNGSAQPF